METICESTQSFDRLKFEFSKKRNSTYGKSQLIIYANYFKTVVHISFYYSES